MQTRGIASGAVAVPTDVDTLALFTLYAHLERSALHFEAVGVDVASYRPAGSDGVVPVFYNPRLGGRLDSILVDNAAFLGPLDTLAFFPNRDLEHIPLAMNPGVVAHEYNHRVFYYEVWDGREIEYTGDLTVSMFYMLRSLNEGIADFFGAMVTDDPSFMSRSFTGRTAPARRMDDVKTASATWVEGVETMTDFSQFKNPYELGTVLASFLWRTCLRVDRGVLEAAVLEAICTLGTDLRTKMQYEGGTLERLVLAGLSDLDRCEACAELLLTYAEV